LKEHLNTERPALKDKLIEYFTRKREGINTPSAAVTVYAANCHQVLQTSYEIAQITAETKKPHKIVEMIVFLTFIRIAKIIFSDKRVVKIKDNSLERYNKKKN
jgi:hypothetical protein